MITYESFFLIALISILGPILGVMSLFFYNIFEKKIILLQAENKRILLEKELETRKFLQLNQQIQPHFLFNALNSLLSLLRLQEYDELHKSFEHLTLYLRSLYHSKNESICKLDQEIQHTYNYLEIQKLRFGERLHTEWELEKNVKNYYVLQHLLITIVENSFKHGLEKTENDFFLKIVIFTQSESLQLIILDNGPGFYENPFTKNEGTGLKNIRNQLSILFPNNSSIDIRLNSSVEQGAKVMITMPLIKKEEVLI